MTGFASYHHFEELPGILHWESIHTIKLSHQITMPSEDTLCNLLPTPTLKFRANDPTDMDSFHHARTQRDFLFANQARQSGARKNGGDGMLLGVDVDGNNIWASHQFACDAPNRAFLQLQVIQDKRTSLTVQAGLVMGMESLEAVATWNQGVQGDSMVERYQFAYDALVEEAKGYYTE